MKSPVYQEALTAFSDSYYEFDVEPVTGGLINQSFKATNRETGKSFLLQQINDNVFTRPDKVQENYRLLWNHLAKEETSFFIPSPKNFKNHQSLFRDSGSVYWRVLEFVEGAHSFNSPENAEQAGQVAKTFSRFTALFEGFDAGKLHITIPDFHNLSLRFAQFQQAKKSRLYERLYRSAPLVQELNARGHYASLYEVLTESLAFKKRVMHHDAKIGNVLFAANGEVICPVDFDTTMPGYIFSDLGDMVRSMAGNKDENEEDTGSIEIRKEYYNAIVNGYLENISPFLTDAEKKYIHFSGIVMIYMQALRFLTDYLNGDVYYKTVSKEQNYHRAANQVALLKKLEAFLEKEYGFKI